MMKEITIDGRSYAAVYDRTLKEWTVTFTVEELKEEIEYQRKKKN